MHRLILEKILFQKSLFSIPDWCQSRCDGSTEPVLPQREGHVLSDAASQSRVDPRDPWLRDCTTVLRATVCLVSTNSTSSQYTAHGTT